MKEITLTRGKKAVIDDCDFERVSQYKWRLSTYGYAVRGTKNGEGKRRTVYMHRFILEITDEEVETDHVNMDKLDNRRENIRACSRSENAKNKVKYRNNTSGFKGVFWHKVAMKWMAQIVIDKKERYIGLFEKKEDAAKAYNEAAIKMHGEFACLNKI